jgi:hypothetical protein
MRQMAATAGVIRRQRAAIFYAPLRQIHCRLLPLFAATFRTALFLTISLGDGVILPHLNYAPSNASFFMVA